MSAKKINCYYADQFEIGSGRVCRSDLLNTLRTDSTKNWKKKISFKTSQGYPKVPLRGSLELFTSMRFRQSKLVMVLVLAVVDSKIS